MLLAVGGWAGLRAFKNRASNHGPETPAESALPTLEIFEPVQDAVVTDPSLEIKGTLSPTTLESLRVLINGNRRARLDGLSFSQVVALKKGENVIRVHVKAKDGREGPTTELRVRYVNAPKWYRENAGSKPSLPLSEGLRFGDGRGEYVNIKDASILVWVPPGVFIMGPTLTTFPSGWREPADEPAHQVTLTRGYFMGKYEVTWRQYKAFAKATRRPLPNLEPEILALDDHPARKLSWRDVSSYASWAGLRIPTEAEWEYAATGTEQRLYPWGNDEDPTKANCAGQHDGTLPVGSYSQGASPFGCLDMAGNVAEWVSGAYGLYTKEPRVDPQGPLKPLRSHVLRDANFGTPLIYCRSTSRWSMGETAGDREDMGFRIARSPQ